MFMEDSRYFIPRPVASGRVDRDPLFSKKHRDALSPKKRVPINRIFLLGQKILREKKNTHDFGRWYVFSPGNVRDPISRSSSQQSVCDCWSYLANHLRCS